MSKHAIIKPFILGFISYCALSILLTSLGIHNIYIKTGIVAAIMTTIYLITHFKNQNNG